MRGGRCALGDKGDPKRMGKMWRGKDEDHTEGRAINSPGRIDSMLGSY